MKRRIAVGVGMSSKARPEELSRLIGEVLLDADIDPDDVDVVATIDTRVDHRAVASLRWPVVGYTRTQLDDRITGTDRASGTDGVTDNDDRPRVAEPAALLAAADRGDRAALVVEKRASARATVAVAIAVGAAPSPSRTGGFELARTRLVAPDEAARRSASDFQLTLTKPPGSLGRLETLGAQLSAIAGAVPPPLPRPAALAVFAADHGVHRQGVTPWPQEVTAQMVANLATGGAAVNVLARQSGVEVTIVDVGVATELPPVEGVLDRKVARGTADLSVAAAMTVDQAQQALDTGAEVAHVLIEGGARALLTGEMGIANTTASAALIAAFTGRPAHEVTGRGTGIDDDMLDRKASLVADAVDRVDPSDPIATLAELGGFEIAALAGYIVAGAAAQVPVVVDGVIAGAALLVASRLAPGCEAYVIAGHRSTEPGAAAVLEHLGLSPVIDLDLRLGEGTGAALALPIVEAAARIMSEMATFDSAGVASKGDVVLQGRWLSVLPASEHGGDGPRLAAVLGIDPADVLDLSQSLNPVAPDPSIIVGRHLGRIAEYPDERPARRALAAVLGVDPARVVLTNGGSEAISLVGRHLAVGWVDEPDFSLYRRSLDRVDPAAPRFRSNPHSPSGRLAGPNETAGVWDEAFYPLATGRWTRGEHDRGALTVGSLTKLFACPGLRIGFVVTPDDDIADELRRLQPEWSVGSLAVAAVPDLLDSTDLVGWSDATAKLRAELVDVLRAHELEVRVADANWVLVNRSELREALLPHGVLVRDCSSFGLADTVRIAVPDADGLDRLDRVLRRICLPDRR